MPDRGGRAAPSAREATNEGEGQPRRAGLVTEKGGAPLAGASSCLRARQGQRLDPGAG